MDPSNNNRKLRRTNSAPGFLEISKRAVNEFQTTPYSPHPNEPVEFEPLRANIRDADEQNDGDADIEDNDDIGDDETDEDDEDEGSEEEDIHDTNEDEDEDDEDLDYGDDNGDAAFWEDIMQLEFEEDEELMSNESMSSGDEVFGENDEDEDDYCGHSSSSDNPFREY